MEKIVANTHHVPILFYLFALIAIIVFLYNARRLLFIRRGKPNTKKSVSIISSIYNAFIFGFAQRKVMRASFSYATVMHLFLGWGFIELLFATTVDFFVARGWLVEFLPHLDTPWFAFVNDLGGCMLFIGVVMALFRRYFTKPEVLPQNAFSGRGNLFGDTGILIFLLLLIVTGFLSEGARLAVDNPEAAGFSWLGYPISKIAMESTWVNLQPSLWWGHAVISLVFIALIPNTKMFHALTVIVNVAFTNRSERGVLSTMHVSKLMEDPDMDVDNITLGASKVDEFSWKQLLDSVACTECARCTSVCPASLTGNPLSPMKIITDIRQSLYDTGSEKNSDQHLVGNTISETELWSCTTCGACMEECPVLIDHVPTFTDMRRYLVLSEGKPPAQASESLEKTMNTGNPWGYAQSDRIKWAVDVGLDLPLMSEKRKSDVLFWVGCAGAYDPRNQKIARSMIKIFEAANIDFAVLGTEEQCTGDSARRLGEEYLFETMALQNIETLNKYSFKKIVTACPHCMHTIKNEYPNFEGQYSVQHHTQFIDELLNSKRLKLNRDLATSVTYHDACYLGRYNDEYDAPRNILNSVLNNQDGALIEMPRNRSKSFCCGAGGGNMWHDIEAGERINVERSREAINTGANAIATACSFCTIMMDDAIKIDGKDEEIEVKDIVEFVVEAIGE